MKKVEIQKSLALIFSFIGIEIWSYLAFSLESVSVAVFIFISALFLAITIYDLKYGLYALIAELVISSMGHLFFANILSYEVSIRTVFYFLIILVFVIKFLIQYLKDKKESVYLQRILNFKAWPHFIILAVFIVVSLIIALSSDRSISSIFTDFNAWLFFLIIFPVLAVFDSKDRDLMSDLKVLFISSGLFLVIKTGFILFVFSQELSISPEIYTWLRKTLVAEVTPTLSAWPRVFLQSHIFAGAFYFFFFWINNRLRENINTFKSFFKTKNIFHLILASLFLSLIIVSFSRSFWLAFVLTLFISLLIIWKKNGFKKLCLSTLWSFLSFVLAFVFIFQIVAYPYFNFSSEGVDNFKDSFSSRLSYDSGEAATVSRWSLLPVLLDETKQRPLFGQGFGATATYISSDPRVLEKYPDGKYTTSAFEWGFLDIALKIGVLGLIAYLFLIFTVIRKAYLKKDNIYLAFSAIILFISITNFFTPYLNHPLGISILLLCTCFIYKNEI